MQPYNPHQGTYHPPTVSITQNPFPAWAIALHILMSFGTCFCWTPIWLLHYALHPKTKTTHTYHQ